MATLATIDESALSDAYMSSNPSPAPPTDEDDQEEFVYPTDDNENQEEFVYPAEDHTHTLPAAPPTQHPSPAQLESLYAAASSGDLVLLKRLFRNALDGGNVESFSLSNDASTRTGLTALHAASSRGYLDIVTWLVNDCGAMPDLEDKEGETALHKAALNGHLHIIKYLLPDRADVRARDADGWTALHNACSKGYLDIVRWLCENGGASSEHHGVRGVDVRSKGGWTPLMNAASKGHLPVVLYLLNKQAANPLVRNNWGETAFDAAAAVFEVWICEVLQKAEAERWRGTTGSYNPLSVHTTVPLILYEHQRLDHRLKTLAVSGGRPKFSASGLGRQGRPAPFQLKLPKPDEDTGVREIAAWRSDVQLPTRNDPWNLPKPGPSDRQSADTIERSHFWLSDWTLDVTPPGVDAEEGWQYAHQFSDADDQWTASKPPQLERALAGTGVVASGLGGSSSRRSAGSSSSSHARAPLTWVRRRRWVRVLRRRLDIPPLPFLEPDGAMYHLDEEGSLIPFVDDAFSDGDGREMDSVRAIRMFTPTQDYVARARYLVGTQPDPNPDSSIEARRAIAKLERATTELRTGMLSDQDAERKLQAEVLLNAYSRDLERRRVAATARGLVLSETADIELDDDESGSDDEFHYPGATETVRPGSRTSSLVTDHFSRPAMSRAPTDLTPQLSQAPDFRVPTHEAPQKVLTPGWSPHQMHPTWERDDAAQQCRDCQRRFSFLLRRVLPQHHCRKCGRIFCDRCSMYRALLDPSDIVQDPAFPETGASASSQRVCSSCHDEVNASVPSRLYGLRATSMERIEVDQERLSIPGRNLSRRQSSSQLSDLAECPVCNRNLEQVGDAAAQESHVRSCLEGGSGPASHAPKYLVYRLPAESTLIGVECVICLEEFVQGSSVARLSCLCSFHNTCLTSWLQRGKSCPIHAR
ncbi:Ankyrin unc44 [Mycena indigotica]|uniref:Ankyrin unc44 n=1 Tax=Mycena indigotica TaxID=2126181 RepID=A0A8H6W1B9_9AGAR|nr:Ankyrin unc44 [Mycena indigotica]KAF7301382.1 Ankyrin unc44 [Mycena indigotica]